MKSYRSDQFQGPRRGIGSSYRSTAEAISAAQQTVLPRQTQETVQPGEVQGLPIPAAEAQTADAPATMPDGDRPNDDESDVEEAEKADRYERRAG